MEENDHFELRNLVDNMLPTVVCVRVCLLLIQNHLGFARAQDSYLYSTWNSGVPIRRVLDYEFNVSWFTGAPNGVTRQVLGVNGQSPGPTIRGTKGDLLRIRVKNQIQPKLNLSIHWHGQHQRGSTFQDGVEQVSQCPLVYGETQVYEFQLLQTGTHWWHSHYGPYLVDGLWGPLIVDNEPEVWGHLYEEELTITLTEWFVKTGEEITTWYLGPENPDKNFPFPHSLLINGEGYYPCKYAKLQGLPCVEKPRAPVVIEVVHGVTYRIRIINGASGWNFLFSIENHTMSCIETDGVDIEPSPPVDYLSVSLGMRYSLLVKMDAEGASVGSEFIIRAKGLFPVRFNKSSNLYPYYDAQPDQIDAYAILRYVKPGNKSSSPSSPPHIWTAQDDTRTNITGVELDESRHCLVQDNDLAPDYFDEQIVVNFDGFRRQDGSHFWTTNGVQFKDMNGEIPALFKAIRNETQPDLLYTSGNGSIVQLVINNHMYDTHPVHLHGHSFWIVGVGKRGDGDYNPTKHAQLLRTKVPKKDTARFFGFSWMVLRYVADNPGVWFLHCHVNWHVPGGMTTAIVEGADILRQRYKDVPNDAYEICVKAGIIKPKGTTIKPMLGLTSSSKGTTIISSLFIYFIVGIQLSQICMIGTGD